MSDGFVNPLNSQRDPKYLAAIARIAEGQFCPFCPEHLASTHPNPLDYREHWIVTDNAYPYQSAKQHLLLIHTQHIVHMGEVSPEAWRELWLLADEICKERRIVGGTLVMRFGETRYTGASVQHLHAQLVQGDPDAPHYDPTVGVRCRVG
jgi:diadenosine tetraphosphate (Ap4A) HIT family hydrolase